MLCVSNLSENLEAYTRNIMRTDIEPAIVLASSASISAKLAAKAAKQRKAIAAKDKEVAAARSDTVALQALLVMPQPRMTQQPMLPEVPVK